MIDHVSNIQNSESFATDGAKIYKDNMIRVKIRGECYMALIDTGAQFSAINEQLIRQYNENNPSKPFEISGSTRTAELADGTKVPINGQIDTQVLIGNQYVGISLQIIPNLQYSLVLGVDMIKKSSANINLARGVITFEEIGDSYAITNDDINVPPMSERIIIANLEDPVPEGAIGECIPDVEQGAVANGCMVGCSLVKVLDNQVMINVANLTHENVTIPRNTRVAKFSCLAANDVITESNGEDVIPKGRDQGLGLMKEPTTQSEAAPQEKMELNIGNQELTDEQRRRLQDLIERNSDLFSDVTGKIGHCTLLKHRIRLEGDPMPVRHKAYPLDPRRKAEVEKQLEKLINNDIIEESCSPWAAPILMVGKKDGGSRFCVDYRSLNKLIKFDGYPVPDINEYIQSFGASTNFPSWYSTLDLESGFFQLDLEEESKELTAFVTHMGLYQFKRVPMGLKSSSPLFQRTMATVLRGLNWRSCLIYIDDLCVFSNSFDQHLVHLGEILDRFREAGLTLKLAKCKFAQEKVNYLGHVISKEGILPDDDKVRAVREFPIPRDLKGVRAFLGLTSYYRRFIPTYAKLASPLYALLQKDVLFEWSEPCQKAFEVLKRKLMSPPVLAYPNFEEPFIVYTDASKEGVGCVLSQRGSDDKVHPICYASRTLTKTEANYSVPDLECLAIYFATAYFKHYLQYKKFLVLTDNISLSWLMSTKQPTGRKARWISHLQSLEFDIQYRSGAQNGNADGLSRAGGKNLLTDEEIQDLGLACLEILQNSHDPEEHSHMIEQPTSKKRCMIHAPLQEQTGDVQWETVVCLDQPKQQRAKEPKAARHLQMAIKTSVQILQPPSQHQSSNKDNQQRQEIMAPMQGKPEASMEGTSTNDESSADDPPLDADPNQDDAKAVEEEEEERAHILDPPWTKDELGKLQKSDPYLKYIVQYIEDKWLPNDFKLARRVLVEHNDFAIQDGLLYHFWARRIPGSHKVERIKQLAVPHELIPEVLFQCHDQVTSAHLGMDRTLNRIRSRYYWPGMTSQIVNYVGSCNDCGQRKKPAKFIRPPLMPLEVAEAAFSRVAMDIIGPLPKTEKGNTHILVMCDYLTRYTEAWPLSSTDAKTIANVLFEKVICRYGPPSELLTDLGSNFMAEIVRELCRMFDIRRSHTSAYHPQTDGLVEKMNRCIGEMLSMYCGQKQDDWDLFLAPCVHAYNTTPGVHGFTPYFLLYGRMHQEILDTSLPVDKQMSKSVREHLEKILKSLGDAETVVKQNLEVKRMQMKQYFDAKNKVMEDPYSPGTLVYLFIPKIKAKLTKKLAFQFHGPYFINDLSPDGHTARLRRVSDNKLCKKYVNVSRLKKVVERYDRPKIYDHIEAWESTQEVDFDPEDLPDDSFADQSDPETSENDENPPHIEVEGPVEGPQHIQEQDEDGHTVIQATPASAEGTEDDHESSESSSDEEDFYEVEKVISKRTRAGKQEFLVKWKNYPDSDNSYVPYEQLNPTLREYVDTEQIPMDNTKQKRKRN